MLVVAIFSRMHREHLGDVGKVYGIVRINFFQLFSIYFEHIQILALLFLIVKNEDNLIIEMSKTKVIQFIARGQNFLNLAFLFEVSSSEI